MEALNEIIEKSDIWSAEQERNVIDILKNWKPGVSKDKTHYRVHDKYVIKSFAGIEKVVLKKNNLIMVNKESVFITIKNIHESCGHKGERKTHQKILETYANIPRKIVGDFIHQCERCVEKLRKKSSKGVVVKPILADDFNERGQVDLVDYQSMPDGPYKHIMHYQDHLTKYHFFRPLTSKTAKEVAQNLMPIFIDFGAPEVLQSDNGREFTAEVIQELEKLWPGLKLVNGRPRYPQSQGSVEKGNDSLKKSLTAWMLDHNTTNWSYGLQFVQWSINTTSSDATKTIPYRAIFGSMPKIGLATRIPTEFLVNVANGIMEEDFLKLISDEYSSNEIDNADDGINDGLIENVIEVPCSDINEDLIEIVTEDPCSSINEDLMEKDDKHTNEHENVAKEPIVNDDDHTNEHEDAAEKVVEFMNQNDSQNAESMTNMIENAELIM